MAWRLDVIALLDMRERAAPHRIANVIRALAVFSAALVSYLGGGLSPVCATPDNSAQIAELGQRLRASDDFRVRTQAALALGATEDVRAATPLCAALRDNHAAVRVASAVALTRTGPKGIACLRRQLKVETVPHVRTAFNDALRKLSPPRAMITESTKFYVALGEVTNGSSRSDAALQAVVRAGFVKYFEKLSGFVVAPPGETAEQAQAILKKHPSVKPLFVWPKVNVSYKNGDLSVKLELSLFTYPDKAFRGSVSRSLSMQEVGGQDISAEDELIDMAASTLVPDVQQQAPRI